LAREAIGRAKDGGSATAWVVATRASASIPFGPFAHLLPATLPPTISQLDLLRRIADTLLSSARGHRLVIGIDDAHLLDDASAALLHHLAPDGAFFVLATLRAGEGPPDSVRSLWKDAGAQRLEVQALPEDLVGQLVSRALGGQVDGPTVGRLWEASRGNVLFLRELLLAGQETNALRYAGGLWSWRGPMVVSPRLQEVLDARLGSLQPDQAALMEVLAYAEPASVSFLETLFSSSTLEAAERQGVVVVEKDRRRLAVRLAHPLYGESVRTRCPVLRARDIQRQLAAALESTGGRRRDDLLRMVTARLESGESGTPELLVAGAHRALASFHPALAERLARAAVDAGGGVPAVHVLAQSLLAQGRDGGDVLAGIDQLDAGARERAITAKLRALGLALVGEGRSTEAEALLLRAEEEIEDAELREELRAVRAIVLQFSAQQAKAIAVASDILRQPCANEETCVQAATVVVSCLKVTGRGDEAVAIADRWTEPARRVSDSVSLLAGYLGRLLNLKCWALVTGGRLKEAEALAREEYRRNLILNDREGIAMSALQSGLVALGRGRVQTAGQWFREAAGLFRTPTSTNLLPACLAGMALAAAFADELLTADAALASAQQIITPLTTTFELFIGLSRAWAAVAHGEVSKGRAIALDVADRAEEAGQYIVAVQALHDIARLGDARSVATRLRRLTSVMQGPLAPVCAAHADALATHDGPALDRAAAAFEAMGAQLLAAEAAAHAAAVYRADGRKASMRASSANARLLLESCEGARTPALSGLAPDPLTPREREVAMLAAKGLTSAEIAQRLVLSKRTVENHVQQAYAKLGVASRAELRSVIAQADEHRSSPVRTSSA
jgi:DNA-binding NarL/FixJ family response regulator